MVLLSQEYRTEIKAILLLAWPIILMNLFRFLNPFFSVVICGHLTQLEFAAATLANSIINVFGVAIDLGFSTACDTLFSQIYGSKSRHKLGLMLQRAMIVMSIVYFLLCCVHLNIEPILILLQQDVKVTRLTARYVAIYLPGLFFDFQFLAISRYLQNQNIVYPMMLAALCGALFNGVSQYIAIYVLHYSIDASALLQGVSCFVMFAVQLIYILISKVYKNTWQGFEPVNALDSWGIFFKLGLPGIIMLGVEEWAFEVGNFIAGTLGKVQLSAQGVVFNLGFWFFTIHIGISIAGAIRCGQFLGSNEPRKASIVARSILLTDVSASVITASLIAALQQYLPYIFTSDPETIIVARRLIVVLIFVELVNGGFTSTAGIYRACGRQLQGAIVMTVCYYCLGIPVGVILIFVVHLDIIGFWYGLLLGLGVEVLIYLVLVFRLNWQNEADRAKKNEEESKLEVILEEDEEASLLRNLPSVYDRPTTHSDIHKSTNKFESSLRSSFKAPIGMLHVRSLSGAEDIIPSLVNLKKSLASVKSHPINGKQIATKLFILTFVLLLLAAAIILKFMLPPGWYIPCISLYNITLPNPRNLPFCNDTMYKY